MLRLALLLLVLALIAGLLGFTGLAVAFVSVARFLFVLLLVLFLFALLIGLFLGALASP